MILPYLTSSKEERLFNERLENLSDQRDLIYFHELTEFDWDTLCVLFPYTQESDKNIPFKNTHPYPDLGDDGLWGFAFVKGGSVVDIIKKTGKPWLRGGNFKHNCFGKANALLEKENSHSETYFVIQNK